MLLPMPWSPFERYRIDLIEFLRALDQININFNLKSPVALVPNKSQLILRSLEARD